MIIDKDLRKYIVFAEDDIITALKKISDNKSRMVFSVTEAGILEGILTDGDFRRWLVNQDEINLNKPVSLISNKNFKAAPHNIEPNKLQTYFTDEIEFVPLLDDNHRLVAVARQRPKSIQIGKYTIDASSPTFIIAEIGINHNGSLDIAKRLIDYAVEAGADCAKFQMRHMASIYQNSGNTNDASADLGAQYTLDLLSKFQLSTDELFVAFDYCKEREILPLCTPWDLESLSVLADYGMPAYKVASADLTNHDLLIALAQTGKPIICSTGMSLESEIVEGVNLLKRYGAQYVLLHCNSTYPAPFKDVNLSYLERLNEIGSCPIGYSGHERGIHVAIAAVAKGAKVIEKHFTLDRNMEGNDHKVSLLPNEFKQMVQGIRQVEEALGSLGERKLSQGELMNRETLAKSLVITCDLEPGQIITLEMIDVKSPGKGLQPNHKSKLVGQKARHSFQSGDFFYPSDLHENQVQPRNYSFKRPWGVPVRYHDYKKILSKSNPDFLEFHLSYKDLELNISDYFDASLDLDLVVHSPDFFSGDFILNLASEENDLRQRSIDELQRVINITRELKPIFKRAKTPLLVASVGGFTRDAFVSPERRSEMYHLIADSLGKIDADGVEIIPQTLPPFPWYFGGQLYLNLFVTPEDTAQFCREHGYRVCLDISHSKLACNYYKLSFKEFIELVAPFAAHLHIVDAEGIDGEGLQIGEGDIDFFALAKDLESIAPNASFIPEIWQGHKNEGEGFWVALDKLEGTF